MPGKTANRLSAIALIVLSLVAFLSVLSGYIFRVPPQADEGAQAHIFQLAVAGSIAALCIFAATADWKRPLKNAAPIAIAAVILLCSFAGVYVLEHP